MSFGQPGSRQTRLAMFASRVRTSRGTMRTMRRASDFLFYGLLVCGIGGAGIGIGLAGDGLIAFVIGGGILAGVGSIVTMIGIVAMGVEVGTRDH